VLADGGPEQNGANHAVKVRSGDNSFHDKDFSNGKEAQM
jgi:hypothetical protein